MLKKFIKHLSLAFAIVTVTFVVLNISPDLAFAQNQPAAASQDFIQATSDNGSLVAAYESGLQNFAQLLSTIVKFLNYLIYPVLVMIGGLMDNSLIFGPGVEDRLYLIWSQIRNLINLFFAIALIGVAIYNILGLSKDGNYSLKTFLPSMVITLVLVNFSFFGVRILLDAANVATTAVFALPNAVEQGFSEEQIQTMSDGLCNNQTLSELKSAGQNQNLDLSGVADQFCNNNELSEAGKASFTALDKNNAALVLAISFGRVHEVLAPSELTTSNPTFINLVVNLLVVVLLEIAYLSAFFALMAVLVARVLAMWIVTIASPLLVLKLGLSRANIPGLSFLDALDLEKMFVKHATAPIQIGLAMSIGYMMLDVFQTVGSPSLYFPLGDDFTNVFSGVSSIHELFVAVAAIGIIWKVSFNAAQGTFAESITNKYQGWAEGLGLNIRDMLIRSAPIIPTGTGKAGAGGPMSIGDLKGTADGALKDIENKFNQMRGKDNTSRQTSRYLDELKVDPANRILNSADSNSKLKQMNSQELELVAKSMIVDNPEFQRKYQALDLNDKLIPALEEINNPNKQVLSAQYKNELSQLIKEAKDPSKSMTSTQVMSKAQDILKRQYGKSGQRYLKDEYVKDVDKTLGNTNDSTN